MDQSWKVRPQLFFRVTLRPIDAAASDSSSDIPLELIYFSLFEPLNVTPQHPLQKAGVEMLYEPSPVPCVYVGFIKHTLCRVPLMPCFLHGNETPTIPISYRAKKNLFPHGRVDGPRTPGSKVYEVNQFLWQYGKGRPKHELKARGDNRVEGRKFAKRTRRKAALALAKDLQEEPDSELSQASSDSDADAD
jgi:hypothetical protein